MTTEDWGLGPAAQNRKTSSVLDKFWIAIFFLIGVFGIWGIKEFQISPTARFSPNVFATSWALAVMIAYAILVYNTRKLRLREDTSGDNIYYLGFLFTLVSLAVSLSSYQASSGVQDIIGAFGVGVASTILGLVLRIVFSQMREDPIEVEREVRLDLADAAASVKRTLFDVTSSMNSLRITIQQTLEETVSSVAKELNAAGEKAAESLVAGVDEFGEAISDLKTEIKSFSKSSASAVKAFDSYFTTLDKNTEASARMRAQIEAVAKVATEVENMLKLRVDQDRSASKVYGGITELSSKTSAALSGVVGLAEAVKGAVARTERALDQFAEGIAALSTNAKVHVDALSGELEKARGYTAQVHTGLAEITTDLARKALDTRLADEISRPPAESTAPDVVPGSSPTADNQMEPI